MQAQSLAFVFALFQLRLDSTRPDSSFHHLIPRSASCLDSFFGFIVCRSCANLRGKAIEITPATVCLDVAAGRTMLPPKLCCGRRSGSQN
mmetsp:Transcript_21248/g.59099  ORF Transcript_21248/g.59099 Transcript_21248/m.59099 type:complete len:90 (-) Transcript_21248:1947-2216(-)